MNGNARLELELDRRVTVRGREERRALPEPRAPSLSAALISMWDPFPTPAGNSRRLQLSL